MRILFISSYLLFRNTRFGGTKRLFNMAVQLQKQHDLSIISFDGCREKSGYESSDTVFGKSLVLDIMNRTALDFLSFPLRHYEKGIQHKQDEIKAFIGNVPFDAVILAYPVALSAIPFLEYWGCKNICYLEDDLLIENYDRERNGRNPLKRFYKEYRYQQALRYFESRIRLINTFITISAQEQEIVARRWPGTKTSLLQYGIDIEEYPLLDLPEKEIIGFIGNYSHTPNRDSLVWFLETIYPAIKKEFPFINAVIAGKNIPNACRDTHAGDNSIEWLEDIGELRDFYKEISVFINPIISGRGMRTKLIEAAAFGRPIISTRLGAEGLEMFEVEIAETPTGYIEALTRMMDRGHAESIRLKNREAVERHFSSAIIGEQLQEILGVNPSS